MEGYIVTSVACWLGVDSRGPSSLNFATDSRVSWPMGDGSYRHWDHVKKIFSFSQSPVILAYAGSVLLSAVAIPSIVDVCDHGQIKDGRRVALMVKEILERQCYGADLGNVAMFGHMPSYILIGWREGEKMEAKFKLRVLTISPGVTSVGGERLDGDGGRGVFIKSKDINVDKLTKRGENASRMLYIVGSGKSEVDGYREKFKTTSAGDTSRSMYWAICDAVKGGGDERSGGPLQLGSLYRIDKIGGLLGTVSGRRSFFSGVQILHKDGLKMDCEFRNELFERVNPEDMKWILGAQRQPKPRFYDYD